MLLLGVLLVSVACGMAQDSTLGPVVQDTTVSFNMTEETTASTPTTTAPQPPPEPPNQNLNQLGEKEKNGRALNVTSLPPLDDVNMEEDTEKDSCLQHQCPAPLFVMGSNTDPLCQEKPEGPDPCCVMVVCSQNTENKPSSNSCVYKNETYQKGDTFNDACEAVCSCEEGGFVSCKPRCPVVNNTKSEKCLTLPDSKDPCCTLVLCDVSLDGHDASKQDDSEDPSMLRLISATPVNSSVVSLQFSQPPNGSVQVEISRDGSIWSPAVVQDDSSVVVGLESGKTYNFRLKSGATVSNTAQATLPTARYIPGLCEYKGKNYTKGEEFHDGCAAYCVCGKEGVECATIDCPTNFGLDVLDSHCLTWETQPVDFVPEPPHCCPDTVKCINNGSCIYKGEMFSNWADIPTKLSGCEQRCYCEMGNVSCHAACPPVPAVPPPDLPCGAKQAILTHQPDDECCLFWMCPPHSGMETNPTDTDKINEMTNGTMTNTSTTHTSLLGPYNPNYDTSQLQKEPKTKQTKHQTNSKKDYLFPGPFSLQHLDEEARKGPVKPKPEVTHKTKPSKDNPLVDILAPFHLPPSDIPGIYHKNSSSQNSLGPDQKENPVPDSKFEDDIPNTNEGLFSHFPFLSPPLKKPTKFDKDKAKPTGFPGLDGQKQHFPFHNFNENENEYSGLFQPNGPPTQHQPSDNQTFAVPSLVQHPQSENPDFPNGVSQGDHEFQYEGERGPPPPHSHHLQPDQVYIIHNQGFPPQHPQAGGRPSEDVFHPQIPFQIPFDPSQGHPSSVNQTPPRYNKKKPIDKHHNQNGQSLPQEILTHLHSLAPNFPKGGRIPPNLHPEEIIHYVQQNPQLSNQQQHPPAHYLTPEEIYLYQNPDRPPTEGKVPASQQNIQSHNHGNPGRDSIHIHSQSIPVSPSQRVEEILAHIRHQNPQQYPGPQFPPLAPHEALLTQHSSHAAVPIGLLPGPNATHPGFNNHFPLSGFPQHPGAQNPNEIKVHMLDAIDDSTVRLIFSVPAVLVGLHGRVELRYTSDRQNSDPATWQQQVLAPPNDLIATPELEFELGGLEPDTTYKIKISVELRDLENSPVSDILTVKTLPRASSTTSYPPEIPVDPELRVAELNATWVKLVWRTFSEYELQFIDGVQLRYKEPHTQVYSATPLIHRAVTSYTIEDLKPDTLYQVGIYFIPFPDQTTELRAEGSKFTTAIENNPYSFELVVDVHHVKMSTVELSWSGVPYPEDKYINIFRAIYQSEGEREDFSSFKVAKRDSPPNTLITGLKPNTRYHLWLEAYLTNGRIKKSNVKDFMTKPGVLPASDSLQGKLEATPIVETSDYYGALVGVSILATLAIATVIILSLILARKHGHNKAPITAANNRKAQSAAYDNPSYKVEIQQETMDL